MHYAPVVLFEPSSGIGGCYTYAGHNEYEPLGLEYIQAVLQEAGYDTMLFRQGNLSPKECVDHICSVGATILGMSVMTHAANSAQSISSLCKQLIPDLIVIAGGYHPSGDENFLKDSAIDFAVIGEGEKTFLELIRCIEDEDDPASVRGIRFVSGGEIISTAPAPRIRVLDDLPFPIRRQEYLSCSRMHGLMLPPSSRQRNVAVILGSRGCPNRCTFCSSSTLWGPRVISRSPENILAEIDGIKTKYDISAIFFSDLTFNWSRKHVMSLCAAMAAHGDIPPWYAMCTTTNLPNDFIAAMRRAGCRKIGFGVEALSHSSSGLIGKGNSKWNETVRILQACDRQGILTKAYLMIGYPWDDGNSLQEFKEQISLLPADEIRISFFTPFPGSRAFDDYRGLLTTDDWSKFNAIKNVVLKNQHGLSEEDLVQTRKESFQIFYNDDARRKRISRKIEEFPEFHESFEEFDEFLRAGNVLAHKCETF